MGGIAHHLSDASSDIAYFITFLIGRPHLCLHTDAQVALSLIVGIGYKPGVLHLSASGIPVNDTHDGVEGLKGFIVRLRADDQTADRTGQETPAWNARYPCWAT